MKTIYVNDVQHELVGRDLYIYRQLHVHDETLAQQELMQKKKRGVEGVGREGWLERILKQAYGDK
ncbi:MAG: hypothetical protein WC685_07570 [Methylobacter sp.]|jgi:hypothetical protein